MTQNPHSNPNSYPTRDAIEQRAREIWEQRGRPDGQELDHWYQAEKELLEIRNTAEKRSASSPAAKPSPAATAKPSPAPATPSTTGPAAAPKAAVPPTPVPKPASSPQPAAAASKVDPKKAAAPTPPKKK
jgi:hypothetical protein